MRQEERIKYFVGGQTARSSAELAKVHKNTAVLYFHKLRRIIAVHLEKEAAPLFLDEGIADASPRVKTPVLGLLKRNSTVYSVPVHNAQTETLLPIIVRTVKLDSIVYTDCLSPYDVLDVSEFGHKRINYSKLFVEK